MSFTPELLATTIAAGPPARLVLLFGSAANGELRSDSDVDIAWLPVDTNVSLGEELQFQAQLTRAAGREVDLVRLDRASTLCRYEVARSGLPLAGDRQTLVRFRAEAIGEYLDFEPALRAAGERYRQALLAGVGRGNR